MGAIKAVSFYLQAPDFRELFDDERGSLSRSMTVSSTSSSHTTKKDNFLKKRISKNLGGGEEKKFARSTCLNALCSS